MLEYQTEVIILKKIIIAVIFLTAFVMGQDVVRPSAEVHADTKQIIAKVYLPLSYAEQTLEILGTLNCTTGSFSKRLSPITGGNSWNRELLADDKAVVTYVYRGILPEDNQTCVLQLRYDHAPDKERWFFTSIFTTK